MADKEVLAAIKAEMGAAVGPLLERIERSEAKAKEIDVAIEQIRKNPSTAPAADAYARALAAGQPITARADETVQDFVERLIIETGEARVAAAAERGRRVRGARINPIGLDFIRTLRAIALAKIRTDLQFSSALPGHDAVLKVFSEWGDVRGAGLVEEARDLHKRHMGRDPKEARAQNSVLLGAGAGFVSTQMYQGIMDFLWPKTVVRALGAQSLPVTKNSIEMLYIDSSAGAGRRGQLQTAAQTNVGEKRLRFTPTLLSAFIAMSNELLAEADIGLDVLYRSQLARAIAVQENLDFLVGEGTSNSPKGFAWWVDNALNGMVAATHSFNRTLATGLPTYRTVRSDLLNAMQVVAEENIDFALGAPGFAMATATKYGLMRCLNTNDVAVFGDEMRGGTLLGAAFADTTQIVKNRAGDGAGSGTGNKADVYFADWSTCVVAEDPGVELKVVDGGTYRDSNGNVVTGLTTNESVAVVHAKNDFGMLNRGKEAARIRSVDWHAAF